MAHDSALQKYVSQNCCHAQLLKRQILLSVITWIESEAVLLSKINQEKRTNTGLYHTFVVYEETEQENMQ